MRFDELRERLLTAGVAPGHVRRYLAELRDHLEDAVEDEMRRGRPSDQIEAVALGRLGSAESLVAALDQPKFRSLAARRPALIFGLGPLILIPAGVAGALLLEAGVLIILRRNGLLLPPPWLAATVHGLNWAAMHIFPVALAVWLAGVAVRQRSAWAWPLLAASVAAIAGALPDMCATFSAVPGQSQLCVGARVGLPWGTAIRAAPTLAAAALAYLVLRRLERRPT